MLSKLLANHNALGQLTNYNTFSFSEGRLSSNPELIESLVTGWGERYCNNVNYVKNYAIFESPSMRACSSTPPKQHQDFVVFSRCFNSNCHDIGNSINSSRYGISVISKQAL